MLGDDSQGDLAATGNASQADAAQITTSIVTVLISSGTANSAKLLPQAQTKQTAIYVRNSASSIATLNLYPGSGERFAGSGTNNAITLAAGSNLIAIKDNTGVWLVMRSA